MGETVPDHLAEARRFFAGRSMRPREFGVKH